MFCCESQAKELNLRQPGFCMPDMLLYGQPSKADIYSRKLYQAELAWDKENPAVAIKKLWHYYDEFYHYAYESSDH